ALPARCPYTPLFRSASGTSSPAGRLVGGGVARPGRAAGNGATGRNSRAMPCMGAPCLVRGTQPGPRPLPAAEMCTHGLRCKSRLLIFLLREVSTVQSSPAQSYRPFVARGFPIPCGVPAFHRLDGRGRAVSLALEGRISGSSWRTPEKQANPYLIFVAAAV